MNDNESLLKQICMIQKQLFNYKDKNATLLMDFELFKESHHKEHLDELKNINSSWELKVSQLQMSLLQQSTKNQLLIGQENLELEIELLRKNKKQQSLDLKSKTERIQEITETNKLLRSQLDDQCQITIITEKYDKYFNLSQNLNMKNQKLTKQLLAKEQELNELTKVNNQINLSVQLYKDKYLNLYKLNQNLLKEKDALIIQIQKHKSNIYQSTQQEIYTSKEFNQLKDLNKQLSDQISELKKQLSKQNDVYIIQQEQITINNNLQEQVLIKDQNIIDKDNLIQQMQENMQEIEKQQILQTQKYTQSLETIKIQVMHAKFLLKYYQTRNQEMIDNTKIFQKQIQLHQDNVFPLLQDIIKIFTYFNSQLSLSDIKEFITQKRFINQVSEILDIQNIDETKQKKVLLENWTYSLEQKIKQIIIYNFNLPTIARQSTPSQLYKTDQLDNNIIVWAISLVFFYLSGGRIERINDTINFYIGNIEIFYLKI